MTSPTQSPAHPCAGCGAGVAFAPGTTALRCPYCGLEQPIAPPARQVREHSYEAFLAKPRVRTVAPHRFTCPGCSARTESDAISKTCQFCGTALVADTADDDQVAPEAVLPFVLDRGGARKALRSWVRTRWFAPNRLKKVTEAESMKSTYLPHWTFDAATVSDYVGQRGEHYWITTSYTDSNGRRRTRRERRTRWYPAGGRVARDFDDVLVAATTHVDGDDLGKLEPWPLKEAVPFQPGYVAGHHSLRYDTEPEAGLQQAKGVMRGVIEGDCRRDIGGDVQRVFSVDTSYSGVTFKLLLLPVWVGTYLFGGRSYQVLINGVGGEVQGDRPYSAVKIALAVLAALAVVAGVVWLYLANHA
ncbi:hypothetical protein FH608_003530 [Nonomuraea phyllanthi]|uniref:Uncharacterized protein n=1 Tax=Nonomuraea phyllanthi TaxID=2219224 RepID=A0A5C4WVL2_9ACTN|nr:hypothetical protein [Nonomuraea phyllanthi]KAB8197624.1 hypothetical protein FH608_003530 [Nonomuraea phyllanthi]QFY06380.1 hypothetical protein GBF35_06545 [Nonomuraea phyllanthi]